MKPSSAGHTGALLALLTAACDSTVVGPRADATSEATRDVTPPEDDGRSGGEAGAGCEAPVGPADCVMSCTGDILLARVCVDGRWQCPPGAMPNAACVPSCSGPGPVCCDPRTGETLPATCRGPNAWSCPLGLTPQSAGTPCVGRDGG